MALTRLLQIVSPALPIGAFAYSQGLEQAVAAGWVTDEDERRGLAARPARARASPRSICRCSRASSTPGAPATSRRSSAGAPGCSPAGRRARPAPRTASSARRWRACSGRSGSPDAAAWAEPRRRHPRGDVRARGGAVRDPARAPRWPGYAFAWAEALTSAAVRLVPLGQSAGQRMLAAAGDGDPGGRRPRRSRSRDDEHRRGGAGAGDRQRPARDALLAAVSLLRRTTSMTRLQPLRVGVAGPVGSGKTALVDALCKRLRDRLRDRGRHQRHLHQGGRAVPDAQRRAARGAHRRRRDRRLPAHRHPRGRLDQPRRRRGAVARASRCSTW